MRRCHRWIAALLVLSPAWWLTPLEQDIRSERDALKYGGAPITLELREKIGQGMAIGLLAGFRGVVADFLWIQNQLFWENREWLRMYRNMTTVTVLQPHAILFWEHSCWHMAWNIGFAVRENPDDRADPRDWAWRRAARDYLADGIRNNPQRWELYFHMGWLHLRKLEEPCVAADYFRQAAAFADAPSYTARECAHALEVCGRPEAAYEYWKKLWNSGNVRQFNDSIDLHQVARRELARLEAELSVPATQRIFP